jgi:hypothetical protein
VSPTLRRRHVFLMRHCSTHLACRVCHISEKPLVKTDTVLGHCWPTAAHAVSRAPSACAAPERAPMSLWPRSFVVPWASLVTGRADLFHHRPSQAAGFTSASWPLHGFGLIAYDLFKILFFFQIQFYSSLNFRNSYLFEYCSKIHGTNSVRFLNSCSTHENYKT